MRVLLVLLLCSGRLYAQTFSVSGVVTDSETQTAIPFAHVFLSNTTHVNVTGEDGHFRLANLQPGHYQLVVSFLGYETFIQSVFVDRPEVRIDVQIHAQTQSLEDVVVKSSADRVWARNLKTFRKHFFGESNARHCKLVNPWVLDFEKKGATLYASASQPLAIENRQTGYRMFFYLTHFEASPEAYSIVGPVRFQELREEDPEVVLQNRAKIFHGSIKHFLKSLSTGQLNEEGFKMYFPKKGLAGRARSPYFERELNSLREVKEMDVLRRMADGSILTVASPLEVHHQNGLDFKPVYKDVLHQVSWIQSTSGVVKFDRQGNITNPKEVVVAGYWNQLRVGEMLPLDFDPQKKVLRHVDDEKVRVVTNQDVYHPGDKIWYTVFVTSAHAGASVRVDLLDSTNHVISSRIDPIEFGRAAGNFELLARSSQTYFIRAVTERGYAEGQAYIKPFVVLPNKYHWKMDALNSNASAVTMAWQVDTTHTSRVLRVGLLDKEGDSLVGNFLVRVNRDRDIHADLKGKEVEFDKPDPSKLVFNTLRGSVTNHRGRSMAGKVSLITTDLSFSLEKELDESGSFSLDDLIVYDSVEWLVQFFNKRGKLEPNFEVTWSKDVSLSDMPNLTWAIPWHVEAGDPVISTQKVAPVSDPEFPLGDARLLKEVTVTARRENADIQTFQSHGSPQYVVKGKDLTNNPVGTNVLSALNGRVPGMIGIEGGNSWTGYGTRFNARGNSSLLQTTEEAPLVIVDGMPIENYSIAYDLLQTIPLTDIDRVEVRTGISPLQGMKKCSGTIAVYTKRDGTNTALLAAGPVSVKKISMTGYSHPASFVSETNGQGTTVHWEPFASISPNATYSLILPKNLTQVTVSIFGVDSTGREIELVEEIDFER